MRTKELFNIGAKTTTARGSRYITLKELDNKLATGMMAVVDEDRDKEGNLRKVWVESVKICRKRHRLGQPGAGPGDRR